MTRSPGLCYLSWWPPVIQGEFRVCLSIITIYVYVSVIYSNLYINLYSEKQPISMTALPGTRTQPWDIRKTTSVNNTYWNSLGAFPEHWMQRMGHKKIFNRRNRTQSMWYLEWAENPLVIFYCLFPTPQNSKKSKCFVSSLTCKINLS